MSKKDDKLLRRCTLSLLITSVCALLFCAVCLVSTTWAWMNVDSTYEGTKIKLSDKCEATVLLETQKEETQVAAEESLPEESLPEESLPEETQSEDNQAPTSSDEGNNEEN